MLSNALYIVISHCCYLSVPYMVVSTIVQEEEEDECM